MSAYELRYEAQPRGDMRERDAGASPFHLEDLFNGDRNQINVSGAIAELTRQGILPDFGIDYPVADHPGSGYPGSDQTGSVDPSADASTDALFSKFDENHDDQLNAREMVDWFDKVAGQDQNASLEDFQRAVGDENASSLFNRLDADQNSQLSMTEWLQYVQKLLGEGGTISRDEFNRATGGVGDNPVGGNSPSRFSPYTPASGYNPPHGGSASTDAPASPATPGDAPASPATPGDVPHGPQDSPQAGGDSPIPTGERGVATASEQQVDQLFRRVENHGASEAYMQELRQSMAQLPASVVQAAIDGGTRIVVNGQGPQGLGGTYSSATNTLTMYESSPFDTTTTLAAEMFHNWDLNPTVGRHISSQPWFQEAYSRARQSGIDTGDNTLTNPFEFIHVMAKYFSGSNDPKVLQMMNFLGPNFQDMARQALTS